MTLGEQDPAPLPLPMDSRTLTRLLWAASAFGRDRRVAISRLSRWEISTAWIPDMTFSAIQGQESLEDLAARGYYETMVFGPHDTGDPGEYDPGEYDPLDLGVVREITRCAELHSAKAQHWRTCFLLSTWLLERATGRERHGMVRHVRSVQRHLWAQGLDGRLHLSWMRGPQPDPDQAPGR